MRQPARRARYLLGRRQLKRVRRFCFFLAIGGGSYRYSRDFHWSCKQAARNRYKLLQPANLPPWHNS